MSVVFNVPISWPSLSATSVPSTSRVPCSSIRKSSSWPRVTSGGGNFAENWPGREMVIGMIMQGVWVSWDAVHDLCGDF